MTTDDNYLSHASSEAMKEDDLAKVSVFLTAGAFNAMARAAESTGDTRTDVMNRALFVYARIVEAEAGDTFSFDRAIDGPRPDGGRLPLRRTVTVVR